MLAAHDLEMFWRKQINDSDTIYVGTLVLMMQQMVTVYRKNRPRQ